METEGLQTSDGKGFRTFRGRFPRDGTSFRGIRKGFAERVMNTGHGKTTESARKPGKRFSDERKKESGSGGSRICERVEKNSGGGEMTGGKRHGFFTLSVGFRIFTVSHGKGISRFP